MAPKSFKRKRTTTDSQTLLPYFSIDIWFEILSWLSPTNLRNTMSCVCKTWYTMIRQPYFVEKNLLRSKSCNYIVRIYPGFVLLCIELYSNDLDYRRLNIDLPGLLHSTSQGLCIFDDCGSYYVINPVTGQNDKFSHIDGLLSSRYKDFSYSAVRDRLSGEVKLVLACLDHNPTYSWYVQKLGTKDSWKTISKGNNRFGPLEFPGISIAGFLIYIQRDDIVVLDVSLETIHEIRGPPNNCSVTYLQMGTNVLSCISHDSEKLFIYVLSEFLAGNWSLYKILDYEYVCCGGSPEYYQFIHGYVSEESPEYHQFLGWIRNGTGESSRNGSDEELFVRSTILTRRTPCRFRLRGDAWNYFTYNLETKRISSIHRVDYLLKFVGSAGQMWVHTPSLVSW